jgi:imidazolonepropionase-like amidohydrolase
LNTFGWTSEQMAVGKRILSINFPGAGTPISFDAHLACCDVSDFLGGEYNPQDHDGHDHGPFGAPQGPGGGAGGASLSELESYLTRAKDYMAKKGSVPTDLSLEAMIPYLKGEAKVLIRVRSASSIRSAVAFAEKHGLKPILAGAADAWKEAKLLASKNIPVLINPAGLSTLAANAPANDWDPYDTTFAHPALLKRAGIKFAFQTDSNSGSFNLPVRVGQSCAYGLSPADALRAITLDAAEILGVSDSLGSLDAGKLGNLVIADGDPMELTTNIVGIFVGGKPIPLESRHTRLRDQWSKRLVSRN